MAGKKIETARQRARREVTAAILEEAEAQLVADGPLGLSLRAVARELGMASSAIYRYFASRDELLTALIIQAYDDLGETAERAAGGSGDPFERWVVTCLAIREWALAHRERYTLIFGTPIPGYAAPESTTESGTRASRALLGILQDAWSSGALDSLDPELAPAVLETDLQNVGDFVGYEGPTANLVAAIAAWSQMYGLITFELFGQTRGMTEHREELFRATIELMCDTVGLRRPPRA
jgi:AcrR family transcriptional regulator